MASTGFVTFLLMTAAAALLTATWRLQTRVHIGEDFVLARRRLSGLLTGVSQAVNCVPLWLLMTLALFAYSMGLAAVWMALATLLGLAINWWFVAPKLRAQAIGSDTLSQWFATSAGGLQAATGRSVAAIVVFSMGFTTLTLLQWAAQSLAVIIASSFVMALLLLIAVLLFATAFAGLWSATMADLLQASALTLALCVVAVTALLAAGGVQPLWTAIAAREPVSGPGFGGYSGVLAIALIVGVLFAAVASAAQPQVVGCYLACRDDIALKRARLIAMSWSTLVLASALLIGWCARALLQDALSSDVSQSRDLVNLLLKQTMPDALAGIVAAFILIAFVFACASPWVTAASHLATSLRSTTQPMSLLWCRVALVVFGLFVGVAASYFPVGGEDRLWLCWHSLSAAFGPLLLVRLTGKKVRPGSSLGAMWSGFILTVIFHLMPDTPGDLLERSLPFIAAMGIALSGGEQRRNPNRADRGDKTVHDHLPI